MRLLLRANAASAPSAAWVRKVCGAAVRAVKGKAFEGRAELSVVLTGDSEMRSLNLDYRGKDRTTDVLSFPLLEGKRLAAGGKDRLPLGDVVVSLPQAARQAKARGADPRDETALLLVHGVLHLLGYDHAKKREEKTMFRLQDRVLRGLRRKGR